MCFFYTAEVGETYLSITFLSLVLKWFLWANTF